MDLFGLAQQLGIAAMALAAGTWLCKLAIEKVTDRSIEREKAALQQELEAHKAKLSLELEKFKGEMNVLAERNKIVFSTIHAERAAVLKQLDKLMLEVEMPQTAIAVTARARPQPNEIYVTELWKAWLAFRNYVTEHSLLFGEDLERKINEFSSGSLVGFGFALRAMPQHEQSTGIVMPPPPGFAIEASSDTSLAKVIELRKEIRREFRKLLGSEMTTPEEKSAAKSATA